MGKGDKKSKRGKIVIGSSGVRRARKKKNTFTAVVAKTEPKPKKEVEEIVAPEVKTAPKKTTKKAVEPADSGSEKAKAAKPRKKAAEADVAPASEEHVSEEPQKD
jgi:30S ribosomal protein S31